MPRQAVLIALAALAVLVGVIAFLSSVKHRASPEQFTRLTHNDFTINIESDAFGLSKGDVPQASGRVRIEDSTLTLVFEQSNTRIAAIGSAIKCSVITAEMHSVECTPTDTPFPVLWTAHLD
jgi:hypothetical protein